MGVYEIQNDFRKPFVVDPRRTLCGVGIGVCCRNRFVEPYLFAKFDMAPKVRISENIGETVQGKQGNEYSDEDAVGRQDF